MWDRLISVAVNQAPIGLVFCVCGLLLPSDYFHEEALRVREQISAFLFWFGLFEFSVVLVNSSFWIVKKIFTYIREERRINATVDEFNSLKVTERKLLIDAYISRETIFEVVKDASVQRLLKWGYLEELSGSYNPMDDTIDLNVSLSRSTIELFQKRLNKLRKRLSFDSSEKANVCSEGRIRFLLSKVKR
ncbi:MAG: super-infection exclusion protein B [Sutterellaceae bacterium]|nr:super-infection exclusion protein B [Sutterellaceae bacterium]